MTPANTSQKQGAPAVNIFAIEDSKGFGQKIAEKIQELTQGNQGNGFALHYSNVGVAYTHLYGLDIEGVGANAAVITRSGDQGSIAELRIPAAAGQLKKVWNIIVGPELAWTAVATTTDYASEAESITAKNALEYYWVDKNVSTKAKGMAFEGLSFGEGALHIPWNAEGGEAIGADPASQSIVHAGDIDYRPVSTWDLIRDSTAKSYESLSWVIVREFQNKFDVAAKAPDPQIAEDALSSPAQQNTTLWRPFNQNSAVMTDLIPVYYLYHKPTPSVPQGRQTVFLEQGSVLEDGPLDEAYHKLLPVVRYAPGEYSGTPFPYTKFFSVLGSAQAADGLARDLLTNATATSGGIIWTERSEEMSPIQLGGGPKIIVGSEGQKPPTPLKLQQSHPEHFALLKTLRGESQQIMGLDNLTAGEEIGANLSGAAMALMTSTSVQNNSQEQSAWAKFVQDIGNVTLAHIQHHMDIPRKIALAGNARADLVTTTELSGAKVKGIDRIQVKIGSALQQTDAGRFELMQLMLKQPGWVETPQQAQAVLDTGRLDALTQGLSNELMLIENENESLARGEPVPVMLGDNHILHLKGHRPVTASIEARKNPQVIQALQEHEAEHMRILKDTDPRILQMFGQPSLAPQGPAPMSDATRLGVTNLAVNKGWAQTPQAAEQVLKTGDLSSLPAQNPLAPPGQPPTNGPSMPVNPATGQRAAPVAGVQNPALATKPS